MGALCEWYKRRTENTFNAKQYRVNVATNSTTVRLRGAEQVAECVKPEASKSSTKSVEFVSGSACVCFKRAPELYRFVYFQATPSNRESILV